MSRADYSYSPALQAPWRLEYLERLSQSEPDATTQITPAASTAASKSTFLSDYWADPAKDEAHHVIVRGELGLILLNAFPYANGHMLVALAEPRPTLLDYSHEQRAALWRLTDLAAALMHTALEPQGVNIGINQGRAAGAAIPSHLHVHLVPRWSGDVNFMTTVGTIRVIGGSLEAMATRYRAAWDAIKSRWPV